MAKVTLEDVLSLTTFSFSVVVQDGKEFDVKAVDPKRAAVLAQYYGQKEDAAIGEDRAGYNLWRECKVEPTALLDHYDDLPTSLKVGVTSTLLEQLGEDHFFRARSKLIEGALTKAIEKTTTSQGENGSSSKLQPTSVSPRKPSEIVPPVRLSTS